MKTSIINGSEVSRLSVAIHFHHHELARPERQLLSPEIQFITDKIESFDFKQRRLYSASKKHYDWDLLVIATGCTPFTQKIPGLADAGDHFYQYAAARQLAHKLDTLKKGRIFITVSFPKRRMCPTSAASPPLKPR